MMLTKTDRGMKREGDTEDENEEDEDHCHHRFYGDRTPKWWPKQKRRKKSPKNPQFWNTNADGLENGRERDAP